MYGVLNLCFAADVADVVVVVVIDSSRRRPCIDAAPFPFTVGPRAFRDDADALVFRDFAHALNS